MLYSLFADAALDLSTSVVKTSFLEPGALVSVKDTLWWTKCLKRQKNLSPHKLNYNSENAWRVKHSWFNSVWEEMLVAHLFHDVKCLIINESVQNSTIVEHSDYNYMTQEIQIIVIVQLKLL